MNKTIASLLLTSVVVCSTYAGTALSTNVLSPVYADYDKQIITNVITGDNSRGCSICDGIRTHNWAVYHPYHGDNGYVPATEKWVITNIIAKYTVYILIEKTNIVTTKEVLLSSTTNRYRLVNEWKEYTNSPSANYILYPGNGIFLITNAPGIITINSSTNELLMITNGLSTNVLIYTESKTNKIKLRKK